MSNPDLDRQGFCLLPHATQVEDFYALETVQARYDAEITEQALTNPLAPPDAPPRESIESRLLVFFD